MEWLNLFLNTYTNWEEFGMVGYFNSGETNLQVSEKINAVHVYFNEYISVHVHYARTTICTKLPMRFYPFILYFLVGGEVGAST